MLITVRSVCDNKVYKRKDLPKGISFYFFILAFIFGLDFGYTKYVHKKAKPVAKLISWAVSIFVMFLLISTLKVPHKDMYWFALSFVVYAMNFTFVKFSKYAVYDFLLDIYNVDKNMSHINRKKISILVWIYSFFLYGTKMGITLVFCEVIVPQECALYESAFDLPYYVYFVPLLGLDLVFVVLILMYCYIYNGLKDINDLFKTDCDVQLFKRRFVAIANSYDKIKVLYEKLVIAQLVLELPKTMGLIYYMLKFIVEDADIVSSIGEYTFALHIVCNVVGLGAMVQMVVWKFHEVKVHLLSVLLEEHDPKRSADISRVLEYMSARELWRPIVGVVPVDMQLPAFALSVCATYTIVVIQFTHLVD